MDYNTLKSVHDKCRNKDKGASWGNNRRIVKTDDGYGYKLHNTVVVEYTDQNNCYIDNGGYWSITSKKAINEALPAHYRVIQRKGDWFLETPTNEVHPFSRGMGIDLNNGDIIDN